MPPVYAQREFNRTEIFRIGWLCLVLVSTVGFLLGLPSIKEILRDIGYFGSDNSGDTENQDRQINDLFHFGGATVNLLSLVIALGLSIYSRRTNHFVHSLFFTLAVGSLAISKDYVLLVVAYIFLGIATTGLLFAGLKFCNDYLPPNNDSSENGQDSIATNLMLLLTTVTDLSTVVAAIFHRIYVDYDLSEPQIRLGFGVYALIAGTNSLLFCFIATPKPIAIKSHDVAVKNTPKHQRLKHEVTRLHHIALEKYRKHAWVKPLLVSYFFVLLYINFLIATLREQFDLITSNMHDEDKQNNRIELLISIYEFLLPAWGALSTLMMAYYRVMHDQKNLEWRWFNWMWIAELILGASFHFSIFLYDYEGLQVLVVIIAILIFIWRRMFVFQALYQLCRNKFGQENQIFLASIPLSIGGAGQALGAFINWLSVKEIGLDLLWVVNLFLIAGSVLSTVWLAWSLREAGNEEDTEALLGSPGSIAHQKKRGKTKDGETRQIEQDREEEQEDGDKT